MEDSHVIAEKIDKGLSRWYAKQGKANEYDAMFLTFCKKNGYNDEEIGEALLEDDVDENELVECFEDLDNFPFDPLNNPKDEKAKKEFILILIKGLSEDSKPHSGDDQKDEAKETELEHGAEQMGRGDDQKETKWGDIEKRYKVKDVLGTGAFGTVIKMKDEEKQRDVAVKKIKMADLRNYTDANGTKCTARQTADAIMNEKEVMRKLNHNNIVKIWNSYEKGSKDKPAEIWFIMEFCGGGNLNDFIYLKGDGLKETVARRFAIQIKDALLYIKSMGTTHRDLKPLNIVLTKNSDDAVLKVTDFGESKFKVEIDKVTANKTFKGTPNYMAPEVLKKAKPSKKLDVETYRSNVDLWSFGVIIYEMITSELPYKADADELLEVIELTKLDLSKVMNKIKNRKALFNLLNGLLEKDPKKREWDIMKTNKWLK